MSIEYIVYIIYLLYALELHREKVFYCSVDIIQITLETSSAKSKEILKIRFLPQGYQRIHLHIETEDLAYIQLLFPTLVSYNIVTSTNIVELMQKKTANELLAVPLL